MFVSETVVFVELPKTGTTFIRQRLTDILPGTLSGKHNRPTADLFTATRRFLGSVRNPWDWYVSLWAYGCAGGGQLYRAATSPDGRGAGWYVREGSADYRSYVGYCPGASDAWRQSYTNPNDVAAFRRWLGLLMRGPVPRKVLGYGAEPLTRFAGLMTYRYVSLFCHSEIGLEHMSDVVGIDGLERFERAACFVHRFVRTETLPSGLPEALRQLGVHVGKTQVQQVCASPRCNTSPLRLATRHYYDQESLRVVGDMDRLIVGRFGYQPPSLV